MLRTTGASTRANHEPLAHCVSRMNNEYPISILFHAYYRSLVPSITTASGNEILTSMANPFGSSLHTKVWQTNASPSQFSIRWAGVYLALTTGQYTFSIMAGAQSSVKLYVDNLFLFETGGNSKSATIVLDRGVNAMYDIFIEFQVKELLIES